MLSPSYLALQPTVLAAMPATAYRIIARLAAAPAATAAPTSPASGPSAAIRIGISRLVSAQICPLVAATKLSQYSPPVVPNPPPTIKASGSSTLTSQPTLAPSASAAVVTILTAA